MSFAPSKLFSYPSRFGRILFFFILFSSFSASLLFFHLFFFKSQIQQQELQAVESALKEYLQKNGSFVQEHFGVRSEPHGLDFIRFVRGADQLLITGRKHLDFSGLFDLAPSVSGTWIDLHNPHRPGNWLLVSMVTGKDGVAQGGKNVGNSGIAVYRQAASTSMWVFLCSSLGCLGLSFLIVSMMERPLRELERTIELALEQKTFTLPSSRNVLAPLYQLLEKIFYQNRALITEMQSSLDNVAHDLRTPMTRLRAVAEYSLQSDRDDPHLYRNALSDCLEESERVLSMLGVMMSVAEAESGTMRLELQRIDILETLEDVIGLYQYVAEEANIRVSVHGESNLLIQADKTRLSQVWANLLDNAIKYGHESGTVHIYAKKQGEMAIVCFVDDGMGISKSEISRIWDRLYRGDRSRTKAGLGLGLNYVKAVVEAHGGEVLVTSVIRKGARFEVRLPLQAEVTD